MPKIEFSDNLRINYFKQIEADAYFYTLEIYRGNLTTNPLSTDLLWTVNKASNLIYDYLGIDSKYFIINSSPSEIIKTGVASWFRFKTNAGVVVLYGTVGTTQDYDLIVPSVNFVQGKLLSVGLVKLKHTQNIFTY